MFDCIDQILDSIKSICVNCNVFEKDNLTTTQMTAQSVASSISRAAKIQLVDSGFIDCVRGYKQKNRIYLNFAINFSPIHN